MASSARRTMAVFHDRRPSVVAVHHPEAGQGVLRVIERGRLTAEPIKETPSGNPRDGFHRIFLDVAVHPRFKESGWIYLTCGDSVQIDGKPITAVTLVRGRINHHSWVESKTLVQVATDSTVTGRIAFDGAGHVFLTTASDAGVSQATGREPIPIEQLLRSAPQDLHDPNGKILRYNDDGTIPSDNPASELLARDPPACGVRACATAYPLASVDAAGKSLEWNPSWLCSGCDTRRNASLRNLRNRTSVVSRCDTLIEATPTAGAV